MDKNTAIKKLKNVIPEYTARTKSDLFQNRLHAEGILSWVKEQVSFLSREEAIEDALLERTLKILDWFFMFRNKPCFYLIHLDWKHQLELKSYDHNCLKTGEVPD